LGLWLSCRGQEAAQVGSARALRDSDWIFPAYREHAVGVVRGVTPAELLSQWRGCSHGGWDPAQYRLHLYSLVLGTQTLHATGYAMGVRFDGSDEVVLAYVGDGATSQGDVNEALNWAAVNHCPIVFFCQNNEWAISTHVRTQTATPLHVRAAGFGLDSSYVDGNDAMAVHAVTAAAVERVRAGGAPAFVEAATYRMAGHSTSDDPTKYRSDSETAEWEARDPLARLRTFLVSNDWLDPTWQSALDAEADQLAADTRAACLSMPEPRLEAVFAATLVEETAALGAERSAYTAYQESFL
jgi:pyruvate dehydrogenase E1 component alpha subunit